MFSMSEVALLANLKHQERLSAAGVPRGIPVAPHPPRGTRVALILRALATRLDPSQSEPIPAQTRLTPAK